MNSKISLLILIFLTSLGNISAQHKNETRNDLINEAIQVSPKIRMLNSKMYVSKSRIEIGTNLPDPMLTLGLMNMPTNSFSFTQEPMTGKIIGLSQGVPFPGALQSASDVKAVDTLIVQQEIEDLENEIRKNVSRLYFDLRVHREEILLAEESEALLKQISEVVKSKYEVSKASLQNIIQVEVQITRVKDKIEMLKGKKNAARSELNALLLRNEDSAIFTNDIPSTGKDVLTAPSLISLAKENRPFLKGIQLSLRKSELMEEKAEYEFYPNFKFGIQYSQRDYIAATSMNLNDFLSVVVGISLPVNYGGKKSEKINEAVFMQNLYRDQYQSSLQSLSQSFGKITAKINELQSREDLISNSLLPQAEQSLQAALADYQVGKIDFVNVINAENDILKIKIELVKIRTEYFKNLAQLEFLTGKEIIKNN